MANKIKVTDEIRQDIHVKVKSGMRPKDIYAGYKDQFSLATFNNILKKLREDANRDDETINTTVNLNDNIEDITRIDTQSNRPKVSSIYLKVDPDDSSFSDFVTNTETPIINGINFDTIGLFVESSETPVINAQGFVPYQESYHCWQQVGLVNIGSKHSPKVNLWIKSDKFVAQCILPTNKIKGYSYGIINTATFKIVEELGITGSFEDAKYLVEFRH